MSRTSHPALTAVARSGAVAGVAVAVVVFVGGAVGACRPTGGSAAATADGTLVVGDAVAELVFADAGDFVDVARRAAALGVVDTGARALSLRALEEAGIVAPIAVALRRGTTDLVLSARVADPTRVRAALAVALPQAGFRLERRLGQVDAVLDEQGVARALLRVDDKDVLLAAAPTDELGTAALLEATAAGDSGHRRAAGSSNALTIAAVGPIRAAQGSISIDGDDVVARVVVVVHDDFGDVVRGLAAPPPRFACAVEEGAVLAARLPPLSRAAAGATGVDLDALGLDAHDAFDGRVVVAVHEPPAGTVVDLQDRSTLASLVFAGHPRSGARAGLEASLGGAAPSSTRTVGGRTVREIASPGRPWRSLAAVVDDDVFAVGIGAVAPVDRVAAAAGCAETPSRLLVVDGRRLRGLVARAMPQAALLAQAVGSKGELLAPWPWSALAAVERLEIDAVAGDAKPGGSVAPAAELTVRMRTAKGRP